MKEETKEKATVVVRKTTQSLTEEEKYKILEMYMSGCDIDEICKDVARDKGNVTKFINHTITSLNTVKETRELVTTTNIPKPTTSASSSQFITPQFLSLIESNGEMYAYYFAQTGDNHFALHQSGLDVGIYKGMSKKTKDYISRVRGQFLRDIPHLRKIIQREQDRRINEYNLEKPQVQMELVNQIEELKELSITDPKYRPQLLKAIELLGKTIGAFQENIHVEETDAKTGLDILMAKVKGEVSTYGKAE